MTIDVGTLVKVVRTPPYKEYNVNIGDIGIVNYVAKTGKYSVNIFGKRNPHDDIESFHRIYGEDGDFWIPFECVKPYLQDFRINDVVRVISSKSCHKGKTGIVFKTTDKWIYVWFGGYAPDNRDEMNKTIINKCIRFKRESLKSIEHEMLEECNMQKRKSLTGYKKVAEMNVNVGSNKLYCALYDEDIKIGDHVLVSDMGNYFTVTNIIDVEDVEDKIKEAITKEIMCKVDLSAYERRVQNRLKAEKLKSEMDKKIAEMDELNKYVLYADKNPELANMLSEYRELIE